MKKIFLINLFITTICFALDFSVYPTNFNLDITKINTEEMYIVNNTTSCLKIEIFPEIDESYGEEYSLNSNIKIFPKIVVVKPAGKQAVRFRVIPSKKEGEFKSYITFKELPKTSHTEEENINHVQTSIGMLAEISIPIYGRGKNINISGEITKVKCGRKGNELQINTEVISNGNGHLRLNYELENIDNGKVLEGKLGNSAREGKKMITKIIPLEYPKMNKGKLTILDDKRNIYYKKVISF